MEGSIENDKANRGYRISRAKKPHGLISEYHNSHGGCDRCHTGGGKLKRDKVREDSRATHLAPFSLIMNAGGMQP